MPLKLKSSCVRCCFYLEGPAALIPQVLGAGQAAAALIRRVHPGLAAYRSLKQTHVTLEYCLGQSIFFYLIHS